MDIDFTTDSSAGFQITLGDNPLGITGNRALMNRFEITLLTKRRQFGLGDTLVVDNYGGDAQKFINRPAVLADTQSISAALATAVDQTVQSMLMDQSARLPDTEKIVSAKVIGLDMIADIITASIQIVPVQTELYSNLIFNLPIIKG